MWLSSTKSNIGFRFVALLSDVGSAEDSFASDGCPGEGSTPVGKYSLCECSSPRWKKASGENSNKLWGEARRASGDPRVNNLSPRCEGECKALVKQNAIALASLWGPHLYSAYQHYWTLTCSGFWASAEVRKEGEPGAAYGLETKWTSPLSLPAVRCFVFWTYDRYRDALEQRTMIGASPNWPWRSTFLFWRLVKRLLWRCERRIWLICNIDIGWRGCPRLWCRDLHVKPSSGHVFKGRLER